MDGWDLIKELSNLSDEDLDKEVAYPSGEYLGGMNVVKQVTITRPENAEGPDRIYLRGN